MASPQHVQIVSITTPVLWGHYSVNKGDLNTTVENIATVDLIMGC